MFFFRGSYGKFQALTFHHSRKPQQILTPPKKKLVALHQCFLLYKDPFSGGVA